MCTALVGNPDCAAALPPATNIASAKAANRTPLPNTHPSNNLPAKTSLLIFSLGLLLHAGMAVALPQRADHGYGQDMLTIRRIASSFGALARRPRSRGARKIVAE